MPGMAICDVCEERCWESLHWIADHWRDLEQMLTAPERGADGLPRGTRDGTGITLNEAVADLRAEVASTLAYWAHVILDEHPGFEGPKSQDAPTLARYVARQHRRITRHHDHGLAASLPIDVAELRRQVRRRAFPSGARLFDPEPAIPCMEHSTSDLGERIDCPGHMVAWVHGRMDGYPDLVCTEDETHRLEPARWMKAGKRAMNEAAARALDAAIREGA